MNRYLYLASPYTHPDPSIRQLRFEEAERALSWMLKQNIWTYSPIVHCHQMALRNNLPTNYEFWHEYNCAMIRASEGLAILQIEGWELSKGMKAEVDYAEELRLSITKVSPFEDTFRRE